MNLTTGTTSQTFNEVELHLQPKWLVKYGETPSIISIIKMETTMQLSAPRVPRSLWTNQTLTSIPNIQTCLKWITCQVFNSKIISNFKSKSNQSFLWAWKARMMLWGSEEQCLRQVKKCRKTIITLILPKSIQFRYQMLTSTIRILIISRIWLNHLKLDDQLILLIPKKSQNQL